MNVALDTIDTGASFKCNTGRAVVLTDFVPIEFCVNCHNSAQWRIQPVPGAMAPPDGGLAIIFASILYYY